MMRQRVEWRARHLADETDFVVEDRQLPRELGLLRFQARALSVRLIG